MSNAQGLVKDIVGAQVVMGTLKAMDTMNKGKSGSQSAMDATAKLTQDVVGGVLLGPDTPSSFDLTFDSNSSGIVDYKG